MIETTREPLAILTAKLNIRRANDAFYRLFKTTKERAEGNSFFAVTSEPEKLGALKRALESVIPARTSLTNHEVSIVLPDAGAAAVTVNVRRIESPGRAYHLILLSIRPH